MKILGVFVLVVIFFVATLLFANAIRKTQRDGRAGNSSYLKTLSHFIVPFVIIFVLSQVAIFLLKN